MQQRNLFVLGATLLAAMSVACQKSAALSPTIPTSATVTPADGATLKASAPSPQSPVGDVRLDTFTNPTLIAGAATLTNGGTDPLQYRFQLFSDTGSVFRIQASGARQTGLLRRISSSQAITGVPVRPTGTVDPGLAKTETFQTQNGGVQQRPEQSSIR